MKCSRCRAEHGAIYVTKGPEKNLLGLSVVHKTTICPFCGLEEQMEG